MVLETSQNELRNRTEAFKMLDTEIKKDGPEVKRLSGAEDSISIPSMLNDSQKPESGSRRSSTLLCPLWEHHMHIPNFKVLKI